MKEIYKKWWFWIIMVLIVGSIAGGKYNKSIYKTKYEWNLKDTKTSETKYDNGDIETFKYVVLGVENQVNDLESGEYIIKTNDNSQASFIVYITNEFYKDISNLPEPYLGMVQGFDKSSLEIKLEKGQYIYLLQNSNGQGKALVEKK